MFLLILGIQQIQTKQICAITTLFHAVELNTDTKMKLLEVMVYK